MAKAWSGKVTRTITKRNVMTKLYGATMPGMRDQVIHELKDLDKKAPGGRYLEGAPEDNYKMAQYIAGKNNEAMKEIVKKADEGMQYVQACTKMLAEKGKPTKWVSPIGLPIEQTYWQTRTQRIDTYWISVDVQRHVAQRGGRPKDVDLKTGGGRVRLNLSHEAPELGIQVKKAEQSIAPNFIHSMDASHLLFIALAWKDRGGCLTTVHDSFGTHAADLPDLLVVVRDMFVEMYVDHDYLYDFVCGMSKDCPEVTEIPRPALGIIDFNAILTATYFCR
jgi:DNA-directed RNA polymerase